PTARLASLAWAVRGIAGLPPQCGERTVQPVRQTLLLAVLRQVHVQRRNRDAAFGDRAQIRAALGVGEDAFKADPEIGASARVYPLVEAQHGLVSLALRRDEDALHLAWRKR